jgi:hypothetical protein
MKTKIIYLIIVVLFVGCSNENDEKLIVHMTYKSYDHIKSSTEKHSVMKSDQYSQFGDYITSITPTVFIAKFQDMRLQHWQVDGTNWQEQLCLLDNNIEVASPTRLADFSNSGSVSLTPIYYGYGSNNNNSVDFNIFEFIPYFFYQEIELPAQYDTVSYLENLSYPNSNIDLNEDYIGGVRNGRIVKGNNTFFMAPIFNNLAPGNFVFGSTDSSYTFYADGSSSINNPIGQTGYIIRSDAFNTITINGLTSESATTVSGTMTFNTNSLIQIYAGQDNVPYTWDDIFVYAPNFWERISVNITQ